MTPPVNFLAILVAALVPLIVGFVWYNKNVFGSAWINATGMTEEKAKNSNMIVIMILSLLFNFFVGFALVSITIHQMGVFSTLAGHTDAETIAYFNSFMSTYGNEFRSFGHGALHGTITGITIALPLIATGALYEQKGWKYILITVGYWTVNLALMGGIICAWKPA